MSTDQIFKRVTGIFGHAIKAMGDASGVNPIQPSVKTFCRVLFDEPDANLSKLSGDGLNCLVLCVNEFDPPNIKNQLSLSWFGVGEILEKSCDEAIKQCYWANDKKKLAVIKAQATAIKNSDREQGNIENISIDGDMVSPEIFLDKFKEIESLQQFSMRLGYGHVGISKVVCHQKF